MFLIYAFTDLNGISNTFYVTLNVDVAIKFHKGFQLVATLKTFSTNTYLLSP